MFCSKCGANDWKPNGPVNKQGKRAVKCRPCYNKAEQKRYYKNIEQNKIRAQNYKERRADRYFFRTYGITLEYYQKLFQAQDGACAICQEPETSVHNLTGEIRRMAVDHCHTTGEVRGLLCMNCNNGLGRFKDDVDLLCKAAEYVFKLNIPQ